MNAAYVLFSMIMTVAISNYLIVWDNHLVWFFLPPPPRGKGKKRLKFTLDNHHNILTLVYKSGWRRNILPICLVPGFVWLFIWSASWWRNEFFSKAWVQLYSVNTKYYRVEIDPRYPIDRIDYNRLRRFLWLSIGIDYQYQSIDKLVSIGND